MAWQGGFKGDSYDRAGWRAYLRRHPKPMSSFIVIHATGAPYTLASIGGAKRMTAGLLDYYKNKQKWKGGPNAFAMGDGRIYPGTPIHLMGVHSPSFNNISTAFEAEGDYRKGQRSWLVGDGKIVWDVMAWATAEWLEWMGFAPNDKYIRFHMDDTRTTHRECPGVMSKAWFINQVQVAMNLVPLKATPIPPAVMPIVTVKPKEKVYMPGKYAFSDYCVTMMKRIEGLRLEPYNDRGTLAIGYGHNASSGQPPKVVAGMRITAAEAEQILLADMTECLRYIKAWAKVPLTQGQVDALILFIFQQGATNFRNKAIPYINDKLHWSFARFMENYKFKSDPTKGLDRRFKLQAQIYRGERPTKW